MDLSRRRGRAVARLPWLVLTLGLALAACDDGDSGGGGGAPDVGVSVDEGVLPDAGPSLAFSAPDPAQGASGVAADGVTLAWAAEPEADGYTVYLGLDYPEVLASADAARLGDADGPSLATGPLQKGAVYFWRVTATVEGELFKSAVWSFSTEPGDGPGAPTAPAPGNGASDVAADADLAWTAGDGATSYRVYAGQDPTPVAAGAPGVLVGEPAEPAQALEDGLAPGLWYWRVVAVNADGETAGPLWRFSVTDGVAPVAPPGVPSGPGPATRSVNVALDTGVTWMPANNADDYAVYFSDDVTNVAAGVNLEPIVTAQPNVAELPELSHDTVYFWRVVARNAGGETSSPVWAFRTTPAPVPGDVALQAPADRAEVEGEVTLEWTPAANAERYAVYRSTVLADVMAAAPDALLGETAETTLGAGDGLAPGSLHYWRVEAINGFGRTSSTVWQFTVPVPPAPGVVAEPAPADLAEAVALDAALSWGGGDGATDFDVYFGQDAMAVRQGTPDSEAFAGTVQDPTWTPEGLGYGQTWFWRVDARSEWGTTPGPVWAFTTRGEPRAPQFSGVDRALALGDWLRADWTPAQDDEAGALTYQVFVWAAGDEPDWEAPVATVQDARTVLLGRDALGALLDGPMAVAVRSMDGDGASVANTVTVVVPSTAGVPQRFVAEGGAGDGAPGAPFGGLGAALAASAQGGVILMGQGRYETEQAAVPAGDAPVVVLGGFDWAAVPPDAGDEALLQAWSPGAYSTLWRPAAAGQGVVPPEEQPEEPAPVPAQTPMIQMEGPRWLTLAGLAVEDPNLQTGWVQGELTVTGCLFANAARHDDALSYVYNDGSVFQTVAGPFSAWLVGNRFERLEAAGLEVIVEARTLTVSNNRLVDLDDQLLVSRGIDSDEDFQPLLAPGAGGTLRLTMEANHAQRVRGLAEVFFGATDEQAGGTVDIRLRGNRARNLRNQVFEFDDLGHVGQGGTVTVDARDNWVLGSQGEAFGIDIGFQSGDQEQPSQADVRMLFEDNQILHTNDDAFDFPSAAPRPDGVLEIVLRRNLFINLESEGIELRTSWDNDQGPLTGSRLSLIIEDNESESVDGSVDVNAQPIVGGHVDIQIRRNRWENDHDYGNRISLSGYNTDPATIPDDAEASRSVLIEDGFYTGEDQLLWLTMTPVAGDTAVTVQRNEARTSRQGVYIDMGDPEALDWPTATGTDRFILRDNHFITDEDSLDLTLWSDKPEAELLIDGNVGFSTDERGLDTALWDLSRITVRHNLFESYDDEPIELDVGFRRAATETDLFVYNNDCRTADDENLDLDVIADEGGAPLGQMNVWVANNAAYGNPEQEGLYLRTTGPSLVLVERNQLGWNDVDSEDAWTMYCNGNTRPLVRGRNNIAAYGGGSGIDAGVCGGAYHNNTLVFSNRDNTTSAGIDGGYHGDEGNGDDVQRFDQALWHSNIVAHQAWRDLNPDEGFQVHYSVIGEVPYPTAPGLGVVEGDPRLAACDRFDDLQCFTLDPRSPAIDAGHPGEAWNDADGTRNDAGAFGGPFAGPIGYDPEHPQQPLAFLGVRPIGDPASGLALPAAESPITAVFNADLDPSTVAASLSVQGADGPVPGAWAVQRNRAVFTPAQPFAAGARYRVVAADSLRGAEGEVPVSTDWAHWHTAAAATPEVEGELAALGDGPVTVVQGTLGPDVDLADSFLLDVQAGDRIQINARADRLLDPAVARRMDVGLRVYAAGEGGALLDAGRDSFGRTRTDGTEVNDPYVDHVAQADGTVRIELYVETLLAQEPPLEPTPTDYVLTVVRAPL